MSNASEKTPSLEQGSGARSDTGIPSSIHTETYRPEGSSETREQGSPPRVLGEYELLERLGAGGMGEVYKARHRRLGKLVALKLLPADTRHEPDRLARFVREMRAIGELDHPNVVEAHDAGEQGGIVYLVMKLVPGTDLKTLVQQRGPLPVAEACELARQTAAGLQYLHERGLIHRDIKPSNLMQTPEGVVKILDLGLARWHATPAGGEDLTASGQPLGTPDYLAPEQASSAADADVRADLYGLGATLFYLLTGRAPFAHRPGMYEKLWAHQAEEPPNVCSLRPDVPAALAELVSRLLAKCRQDRPQTPAEVVAALTSFTAGSVDAVPAKPPRGAKNVRRIVAVAAAGALLLLMALALWWNQPDWLRQLGSFSPFQEKDSSPATGEPIQVVALDVRPFAKIAQDGRLFDRPCGLLGHDSFAAYDEDGVTITARLSRPAYAYLIAFRPDGTNELCFPEDENEPPPLTDQPCNPAKMHGLDYGVNDGTAWQVFAVVVSREALPAYRNWRTQRGAAPWKRRTAAPGVVWRDDGTKSEPLTDPALRNVDGEDRSPLTELTDWLRQDKDIATVAAVAFAVRPKKKL
ncbi:MAG TPA: serine/threonine-protein kinase [Gemmataceae bacterium]|nr:serine/threonine-protein kinase [Gemmataceae bacterium]